jgi:TonB family protein
MPGLVLANRRTLCLVAAFALVAATVAVPASASAQRRPEQEEALPSIVPPALEGFVEAEYPAEAEAEGLEAEVELLLTIAANGSVLNAEVVTPAGHGFDEAAVAAARQFRFTPARAGGVAIPARIRYRYVFELDAEETPPAATDGERETGRLVGRVLATGDDAPLGYLTVTLGDDEGGEPRTTVTDESGAFVFDDIPAGVYRVRVEGDGLTPMAVSEEVAVGEETAVTYRLANAEEDEAEALVFEARAEVDPPPREVTRRTIPREALTRIPGTRGDALRAVELLPGVGRPAFGGAALIVRGSAPGDSEVLLEGVPVPLLYHFGGLTSFFNSRLLDRIDFYPGNFSARYGRRTGGILDVGVRDPATDRFHGVAEFGVIDASLLAEGPITDELSVGASVRRSIIDVVFKALLDDSDIQITNAPVYYDYQFVASWRPNPSDELRLLIYGSSDAFKAIFDESLGDDPNVRGNAQLATRFHYHQLQWRHEFSDRARQDVSLSVGPTKLNFRFGDDLFFFGDFIDTSLRSEWRFQLVPAVELIVGTDVRVIPYNVRYRGPAPRQSEGAGGTDDASGEDGIDIEVGGVVARPAIFAELGLDLGDLRLVFGGRGDYFSDIDAFTFDPRLAGHYQVTDRFKLKAGVGLFSQPPEFQEANAEIGNPDLDPIRSLHVTAGGDYEIDTGIEVGVEGFYKLLWDRAIATVGGAPPNFLSLGIGRIYGLEVSGRIQPQGRDYFGYLSYTLSRSERRDHLDQDWRLFDFDQTHIFTAAYVHQLPRGWELGGTLRIVSGNPFSSIPGAARDLSSGVYTPLPGSVNSQRSPLFNRLDVRIEKKWVFDAWRLALFLDVQNVYNRQNREGIIYNFDYTETAPISGLPIIPALGIRGEM